VILKRIGIQNFTHKARPISYRDYEQFDFMFGMDYFHIEEMTNAADALKSSSKIFLLGEFNPDKSEMIIRDPIGSSMQVFEKCHEQIAASCEVLLEKLIDKSA
jgi:protein-tyrosine-phosphatase